MNRPTHKYSFVLLLAAGLLAACNDDSKEINLPVPDIVQMTITETMTSDTGPVSKTEIFTYQDGRLISHDTEQTYYEQSLCQTTTLTYTDNTVVISYPSGDVATYTLGANGYATQATYQMGEQLRTYQFDYSDEYLTQVDEFIDGTPFMSNTLTYDSGNLTSISFGESNKMTCTASETINYGYLPFTKLADFHPLSMHMDAMYAHLLGKPTQHMVSDYEPVKEEESADPLESEKTTYTYATDNQKRVTSILEKTIYTGYTYDISGNRHLTTNSTSRELTISYN